MNLLSTNGRFGCFFHLADLRRSVTHCYPRRSSCKADTKMNTTKMLCLDGGPYFVYLLSRWYKPRPLTTGKLLRAWTDGCHVISDNALLNTLLVTLDVPNRKPAVGFKP